MDRRLFMQLLVYDCPAELQAAALIGKLGKALGGIDMGAVIYEDLNNPRGIGLLSMSEQPADFVDKLRPLLNESPFRSLQPRAHLTMFGRSYASGFEADLPFWLLERPINTVLNEAWPWAIWYPLRRSGAFAQLPPREQGKILREHAVIGRAYGEEDLAHDVRLACHGLDENDNEFVIGLCGKALHPLSHVVQSMRKTTQTAQHITQMGPFFVGRRVWRSA